MANAVTRISDLIVPEIFVDNGSVQKLEKDIFIEAGIATTDARLQNDLLMGGGEAINLKYFNQITFVEPDAATDDPAVKSESKKHGQSKDIAMRQPVHQSWSNMDLASELAGSDVVGDIVSKVEGYWQTDRQFRLVNSCVGVIADNVANDGGDMVYDISAATGDAVTSANKISATAIIETLATMGDRQDALTGLAVHSVVYKQMQIDQLIDYIRNADNTIVIPFYLGKRVIVDDGLYALAYGSPAKVSYQSILFGSGAFAMGAGMDYLKATAVDRDETAGNGSGEDILHSRRQWAIHPLGFQFAYATVSANCPTYTELKTAALWDRILPRKHIRMACLITNG